MKGFYFDYMFGDSDRADLAEPHLNKAGLPLIHYDPETHCK